MSIHVVKRPSARRDIVEIAVFIAEDSVDASDRFLEAVELTFQALARMPRAGAPCRFRNPGLLACECGGCVILKIT